MKIFSRPFIVALFTLILFSCSDEQDFDQFDALNIIPTAEASLVYLEVPEEIINQGSAGTFYIQTLNFDAFEEGFFAENVLDGVITYEAENTTSKPLDITLEFLDESGNVLDTENFMLGPAPTAILQREISYGTPTGRSIDIITSTSAIRITGINLGDTTSVSSLPDPSVFLRSSAEFRIELK